MAPAIVKSRLRGSVVPVTCPHCKAELEYDKASIPSTSSNAFQISCCRCVRTFEPASTSASKARSQASSTAAAAAGRRRIGTQASPLDTSYYDILQVPVDADTDAIKKSYRKLALKHHPDKLSADKRTPEADEVFKQISVAYTVLSNPEERKKYNEFGPASKQQENGFVDPEEVFSSLFGGERFEDIIGKVSIGAEMKASLQREHDQQEKESGAQGGSGAVDGGEGSAGSSSSSKAAVKARKDMTPEEREADRKEREAKRAQEKAEAAERARVREERVSELYAKLMKKIAIFTEQAASPLDQEVSRSVRAIWAIEADELKEESYGVELLHAVGEVYLQRSQQYVASHNTVLGFGGWWSGMKNTANVFSDTISTLRSAYELTDVVGLFFTLLTQLHR